MRIKIYYNTIQTAQLYDSSYRQVSQINNTTTTPSLFNIPMIPNQTAQNSLMKQLEELTTKVNQLSTRNNSNNNQQNRQNNNKNISNKNTEVPYIYCGLKNHLSVNCYVRTGKPNNNNSNRNNNYNNNRNNNNKSVTCYNCGRLGHLSTQYFSRNNNNNNNNNNYHNNNNNNNNNRPNNQRQNNFLNTEEHLNE